MFSKKQNLRKKGRKVFTITFFATNYLLYNKTKIWERIQFDPSKAGASSIGSRAQVLNVRLGKGYMYIVYVDAIRFNLDYCMYVCSTYVEQTCTKDYKVRSTFYFSHQK